MDLKINVKQNPKILQDFLDYLQKIKGYSINTIISDIDFKCNSIKVIGKGNKERIVYFNDNCKEKIKKYLEIRRKKSEICIDSLLFINNKGNRLGIDGIDYICKKAYKLANLEKYGYTIHTLRHTAASIMYRYVTQDILVLRDFLGHKSIKSTEIYTHVYNKQLKEAMDKHPLNNIERGEKKIE